MSNLQTRSGLHAASASRSTCQNPLLEKEKRNDKRVADIPFFTSLALALQDAVKSSQVAAEEIGGIGFDATCSLVVLDKDKQPVSVSPTGLANHNIVLWMDHRAAAEVPLLCLFFAFLVRYFIFYIFRPGHVHQ